MKNVTKRWLMVLFVVVMFVIGVLFGGCSSSNVTEKAIIKLPTDEVITVDIKSYDVWSSNIEIRATDGKVYKVSFVNCTIIKTPKEDK